MNCRICNHSHGPNINHDRNLDKRWDLIKYGLSPSTVILTDNCCGLSCIYFVCVSVCHQLMCLFCFGSLISSPEPSGSQGELIVYPYSGVRCRCRCCCRHQQCLNIFSSETALPIKAKFYMEPPWEGGTKIYINGPGHMTKMAAMPIYGKNL